jgi:hypothetical protein
MHQDDQLEDDSSFNPDTVEEDDDDRHIVDSTFKKRSFENNVIIFFKISQKNDILSQEWGNVRKTARYFGVCPKTIRNWKHNIPLLKDNTYHNPSACSVTPDNSELEEELIDWCAPNLMEYLSFRTKNILQQSLTVKPNLKNGNKKRMKRWIYAFMEQWNLSVCKVTHVGQSIRGSLKLHQAERTRSVNSRLAPGATLSYIKPRFFLNMNQTAIYFESRLNYTVARKG